MNRIINDIFKNVLVSKIDWNYAKRNVHSAMKSKIRFNPQKYANGTRIETFLRFVCSFHLYEITRMDSCAVRKILILFLNISVALNFPS